MLGLFFFFSLTGVNAASADTWSLLLECGLRIRAEKNGHQAHQQVDCDVSESPDQIFQTLPHWFPIFISTGAKHDQAKARSHPRGKGQRKMMGTGPPPGCSALALVSTWLCPLSASQRAAEWGSIETNSFCRTQLMGLPRPGRKGGCRGPLVTDPAAQACQEFATWNLPYDNNKPTPSQAHLLFCTHMDTS